MLEFIESHTTSGWYQNSDREIGGIKIETVAQNTHGIGGELTFWTGGDTAADASNYQEQMRIDSAGNVGIGTTAPGTRLDVKDGDITIQRTLGSELTTDSWQNTLYNGRLAGTNYFSQDGDDIDIIVTSASWAGAGRMHTASAKAKYRGRL